MGRPVHTERPFFMAKLKLAGKVNARQRIGFGEIFDPSNTEFMAIAGLLVTAKQGVARIVGIAPD